MITFEQARAIGASSPEVLQRYPPGGVEIANGATRTAAISSSPDVRRGNRGGMSNFPTHRFQGRR